MNLLYTVNTWLSGGGFDTPFIPDARKKRFEKACFRWGCDYAELNHFDPMFESCHWERLHGPRYFAGFEKVLYLDGDMRISDDCPNPFNLCTQPDTLYCVKDAQPPNPNPTWEACVYGAGKENILKRFPSYKLPPVEEYFNSGFLMFFNGRKIRTIFEMAIENRDLGAGVISSAHEQTLLNILVYNNLKICLLPTDWNYIVWNKPRSETAYINHTIAFGQFCD